MALPTVAALPPGGTISSTESRAPGATLSGEELVEAVPELAGVAEVSAACYRGVPSPEPTIDDVVTLCGEANARLDAGGDAGVVAQGTDTTEEMAFVLALLVDGDETVVVPVAMQSPTLPGAGGPSNLLSAARVAASGRARGLAVVAVPNGETHAADPAASGTLFRATEGAWL